MADSRFTVIKSRPHYTANVSSVIRSLVRTREAMPERVNRGWVTLRALLLPGGLPGGMLYGRGLG